MQPYVGLTNFKLATLFSVVSPSHILGIFANKDRIWSRQVPANCRPITGALGQIYQVDDSIQSFILGEVGKNQPVPSWPFSQDQDKGDYEATGLSHVVVCLVRSASIFCIFLQDYKLIRLCVTSPSQCIALLPPFSLQLQV